MAESPDHAAAGAAATTSDIGNSQIVNLSALVATAPGAAQHPIEDKVAGQSAEATGAPAARARSKRFMMLAASVAFAAGFGSFVGSVSGSGLVRLIYPPPAPVPRRYDQAPGRPLGGADGPWHHHVRALMMAR